MSVCYNEFMPPAKTKKVSWVDILKPAEKDLTALQKEFDLHPLLVQELRNPSSRTRVEARDNYLYFIYYFPLYDIAEGASMRTEVDIIVTKNKVVAVHYDTFISLFDIDELESAKDSL